MNAADLFAKGDTVIEQALTKHLEAEIPGDSETISYAREVALVALLGRFPVARNVPPPAALPLVIPISPSPPVEAAPEVPQDTEGDVTPGPDGGGETREGVLAPGPPPVPPKEHSDFSGRDAAQLYIEECLRASKGVNKSLVGAYLGTTLASAITKFITATQDAYHKKKHLTPAGKPSVRKIEDGFANLLRAVENAPDEEDDEEPEPEELAAIEAAPKVEKRNLPRWWSEGTAKYCPGCMMLIQPRYFPKSKTWEALSAYQKRVTCGRDCPKSAGKSAGKQSGTFREEATQTRAAA